MMNSHEQQRISSFLENILGWGWVILDRGHFGHGGVILDFLMLV
jgi:hypothetical protein